MTEKESTLFDEFTSVSKEKWIAQLEKDLKGVSIQDSLELHDPIEQFDFQSHFHWSDKNPLTESVFSNVRGTNTNNDWVIRQTISNVDAKSANVSALKRLNEGASGIGFSHSDTILERLNDIAYSFIQADFSIKNRSEATHILKQLSQEKNCIFSFDPILDNKAEEVIDYFQEVYLERGITAFEIDNTIFATAGANITQQLGIALSQINEYLHLFIESGYKTDVILNHIQLKLGIGQSFIYETAKFRAIRLLVENLATNYDTSSTGKIKLHAESIALNKSLKDPHTNLLRLTTEAMSAAMGGVETITLLPYDFWSKKGPSDFAYRMSVNISNILKEESYLNIVTDPIGGAYAIEQATKTIAEEAWTFFQKIEANGGFIKALQSNWIKEEINKIREIRISLLQEKKTKYIGINCFENKDKSKLEWDLTKFSSIIEPLILELHTEGGKR